MSPTKKKSEQASADKKDIYVPVYKVMLKVIEQLRALELDVPIYKLAWLEVRGKFTARRHKEFRTDLMEFLRISNEYRRIYWNLMKLSRRKFEVEMISDGSFAPDVREYESLKNEIPNVIIRGGKKLWIDTYNDYLPRIRERSLKKKTKPRDGAKIYRAIYKDLKEVKETLMAQQKESLSHALELKQGLKLMKREPHKPWGFWKEPIDDGKKEQKSTERTAVIEKTPEKKSKSATDRKKSSKTTK